MDTPDTLVPLCARSGLLGADAESAIRAFRDRGSLQGADLINLSVLTGPARESFMARRWGADGARVAVLVADCADA